MKQVEEIQEKQAQKQKKQAESQSYLQLDDFKKVEMRVGKVLSCEKHPDADSLLIMKIDLGTETRQIVSGIAPSYTPGQMIGKSVIVVTNLKHALIRGIESEGMLLAGKNGEEVAVAEVNGLVPGTRIS